MTFSDTNSFSSLFGGAVCGARIAGAKTNPVGKKFCGDCGAPLSDGPPVQRQASGERRHLTVLFCDLVGSTEIAARLDPEDWREVVGSYRRATTEAVTHFGGYIAHYAGDGIMALFGYPEAHDNDAERAVRAGLGVLDAIAKLNEQVKGTRLAVRVGIDSGAIVIGRGADVFGEAPNIAARTQTAAQPGTVLITDATQRLISGLFVVEDHGAQVLKGIERPIRLYRVIQPSGVRGRLEAVAAARGLTPFVGREDELRLLMSRWERALNGDGQAVLIIGEAGIGKSRLVQHFDEQITATPHLWAVATASPLFQNTPLYAVADVLRDLAARYRENFDLAAELQQFSQGPASLINAEGSNGRSANGGSSKGQKLEQFEALLGWDYPLIVQHYRFVLDPASPVASLDPAEALQQRGRMLSTVVSGMLSTAQTVPIAIGFEDLQWADPSTLELIELLTRECARAPLLLLFTARPEFRVSWRSAKHLAQITLKPLNTNSARTMVERVAKQTRLPEGIMMGLVERAGGVPLFVEELTRAVLESGNVMHARTSVPVTLHDSLMARLDRLGAASETLQLAAVLGIEFTYEFLLAVTPLDEEELQRHLVALTRSGLLYAIGLPPSASYKFKHTLIRDAAYEALLKSRRRELHSWIAQTIEERFPNQVTSHPEILAYHYSEAGLFAQAVRYWGNAGKAAIARSAHVEAIGHLRCGLELLGTAPPSPERDAEELRLQLMLTTPLAATKGYTDSEVEQAGSRARDLCDEASESPRLFAVLGGLFSVYHNRGEYITALGLARRMLTIAEQARDKRLLLWAHYAIGFTLQAEGDFPSARFHLEQSAALYEPGKSETYGWVQNPGPTALGMLAHVLCSLGYPDQGLRRAEEAVAMARALHHPYTLAWVLGSIVGVLIRRGEHGKAKEFAEERIALCAQHGFSTGLSEATLHYGFILVQIGRLDDGVAQMRKSLEMDSRTRANQTRLYEQYLAAKALAKIGQRIESLAIVDPLLPLFEQTSENSGIKVDVCVLKGDLLLMEGSSRRAEAMENYRRAIELARQNSDRTAELEATMRIARLLDQQQRRDEARTMLTEIYGWFTEGFDTADLKEAKALLDELSR